MSQPGSSRRFFRQPAPHLSCRLWLALLVSLSLTSSLTVRRAEAQAATALEAGQPVERELAGAQEHAFLIQLAAGQFLNLVIEQKGIDVVVELSAPDGAKLVEVDSPNGMQGPEPLAAIALATGSYRLVVRSLEKEAAAGRYEAKIVELRAATESDRNRIAAQKAYAEAEHLRGEMTAASLRQAITKYLEAMPLARAAGARQMETDSLVSVGLLRTMLGERQQALLDYAQALTLSRAAGDRNNEAVILNNLGAVHNDLGEQRKALDYYASALVIYRELGERAGEGRTLNNIGRVYDELGEKQKAIEHYQQGLPLSHAAHDYGNEATILNNLAKVANDLGENQLALDYYARTLPLLRAIGDRRSEAIVLNNLGRIYGDLGDKEKALEYFMQALPALRAVGDRNFEALTLNNLGGIQSDLGDKRKALEYYRQAQSLFQALGDRKALAATYINLGTVHDALGDREQALDFYQQALTLSRTTGDRMREGIALNNIGWSHYLLRDWAKALEHYERALALARETGNRMGEATTLDNIALVEREQGKLLLALGHQERVLEILESLRTKVVSQELRTSYFATVQKSYELYVDILMRLHKERPSEGYAGRALHASERGRARSLLEVLAEAKADLREGVDAELLARARRVQEQLEAKEAAQLKLLSGAHTAEQESKLKQEMASLLDQYRVVNAEIRASSPRYAALTQPQPLKLEEIQREVLDADTLLLEYSLGEERSYLWAVTRTSLRSYELPSRRQIEGAARLVYELVNAPGRRVRGETKEARTARLAKAEEELAASSAALGRLLLSPVAVELGKKRLVIVGDGALQYIPFAALQVSSVPLIVEHEIITLPSASTLAVLRRETRGRKPAPKMLAVLADPVFEKDDRRLPNAPGKVVAAQDGGVASAETRILEQEEVGGEDQAAANGSPLLGRRRIPRLPFTRQEAERILAISPASGSIGAFDFKATRELVSDPSLGQYRFLHFATHGYLDASRPELSALVLSLVDERGNARPGFLRAHEVYNLRLPAELVVLSACQTGLGKEIKGEGLVGLTRGFMYAGSPRVVVSLWSVSDRATAELMEKFYRGVLVEKRTPAAALRAAQIAMSKDKRWSSPYYWAAFTLQGEWR